MPSLLTVGETRGEAIASLGDLPSGVRVVSCREIDLSYLPRPRTPAKKQWVVTLEGEGLSEGSTEAEIIEQVRAQEKSLGTDPHALVTAQREGFECPACGEQVWLDLPAPRSLASDRAVDRAECPECRAQLMRRASTPNDMWQVVDRPADGS
jgi:predicted RNA-binding Zn-ribbon protein involved in translation (DUF1610 family)